MKSTRTLTRRSLGVGIATVLMVVPPAHAQAGVSAAKWADSLSREIDKANLSGDAAKLDSAAALADRAATAFPTDGLILHYLGYALYRQGMTQMARGAEAQFYLTRALSVLDQSLKTHPLAESHMLMATMDGVLIGTNPSRAMELGMASQGSSAAAEALGPNNPRVWLLRGQGALFAPPEYGGGLPTAEAQLKRAVELFAKDAPKPGEPSWGRPEAYVWLGQVYEKKGDKVNAAAMYQQALSVAPNFAYAKTLAGALR